MPRKDQILKMREVLLNRRDALRKTRLITISPLTTETLAELGHQAAAEAGEYTTDGVIDALLRAAATDE